MEHVVNCWRKRGTRKI